MVRLWFAEFAPLPQPLIWRFARRASQIHQLFSLSIEDGKDAVTKTVASMIVVAMKTNQDEIKAPQPVKLLIYLFKPNRLHFCRCRPFYEPPGSLLVSMRHLKNLALFKIAADDLQSDRQSQGRKPTTEADSRQPRHIKRHRESGIQAYACRLKRNFSAVNFDESPFALFDGRRGDRRGRCHY